MHLSDDGNYMGNGTEWVPVEAAPAPAVPAMPDPAAPAMPTPAAPMAAAAPQTLVAPVVISTSAQAKPAISLSSALSVFKYGFLSLVGWFVSMVILTIVWWLSIDMAWNSDDAIVGMIILIVATLVTIIAFGQMVIYPVGKALKDGRTDNVKFSYVDSWKTSFAGFVESIIVTAGLSLMIGLGIGFEMLWLSGLGGLGYFFFLMGYVPYMVRKAAEIMR